MNSNQLREDLAKGWNTWNTRSMLSHVLLPEGLAINIGIKEYYRGLHLREALMGRQEEESEKIIPGPHAYDGSYTELTVSWQNIELLVQTAHEENDLVILVTPIANQRKPAVLTIEIGMLWNQFGMVYQHGDHVIAKLKDKEIAIYGTHNQVSEPYINALSPYLAMEITGTVGVSTGTKRTIEEITHCIHVQKSRLLERQESYGELSVLYEPIQTCMAWNTIYEPSKKRVISTVSRLWNIGKRGGYAMFCWDTYFGALLAGIDNKELAYSNVIEMTLEKTKDGFVPNCIQGTGRVTLDGSQPPVGSMVSLELYNRYKDRWFLEEIFDHLLEWNRWWYANRRKGRLLCLGSTFFVSQVPSPQEIPRIHQTFGAATESGLDNSPMYDDVPFNKETSLMEQYDVGINSLYVMDCQALAEIAKVLGLTEEEIELTDRAVQISCAINDILWDEDSGLYYNKRTDENVFNRRISPTSFYPMLGKICSIAQVERMVDEHLNNENEFGGAWGIPSSPRSDPAFSEQHYVRGRIWPPINFLVYWGLRNYNLPEVSKQLVDKSVALLLKEWNEHRHIHENYCAYSGEGCNKKNSDPFYHWGGLLGLMPFIEKDHFKWRVV